MAVIVPTVTTDDSHLYREQVERVVRFSPRIHIDLADGILSPNKLMGVTRAWLPEGVVVDVHLMFKFPTPVLIELMAMKPSMVIIHAEARASIRAVSELLKTQDICCGVAILQETQVEKISDDLKYIDHVLVFSGTLGSFGGQVDLNLLEKVKQLKAIKPELEIGWDGGINALNATDLVEGGVDVLNVGGFIQKSADPAAAYAKLQIAVQQSK